MAIYQNSEKQSIGTPRESLLVSLATGSGNYWFSFVSDPLTVVFFLFWEATSSCAAASWRWAPALARAS